MGWGIFQDKKRVIALFQCITEIFVCQFWVVSCYMDSGRGMGCGCVSKDQTFVSVPELKFSYIRFLRKLAMRGYITELNSYWTVFFYSPVMYCKFIGGVLDIKWLKEK